MEEEKRGRSTETERVWECLGGSARGGAESPGGEMCSPELHGCICSAPCSMQALLLMTLLTRINCLLPGPGLLAGMRSTSTPA